MASGGLGAFLNGLTAGVDTRRRWTQEDEDQKIRQQELDAQRDERGFQRERALEQRDWTIEDRKKADEDRDYSRKDMEFRKSILLEDRDMNRTEVERRRRLEDYETAKALAADAEANKIKDAQKKAYAVAREKHAMDLMADRAPPETPAPSAPGSIAPVDAAAPSGIPAVPAPMPGVVSGRRLPGVAAPSAAPSGALAGPMAPSATATVPASTPEDAAAMMQPAPGPIAPPKTIAPEVQSQAVQQRATRDFMDYYMKEAAPMVRNAYLEQGDIEKAKGFDEWMKAEGVRRGMESYASAVVAAQRGDEVGFINKLAEAFNNQDYYGDGYEVDTAKTAFKKDASGNVVGGVVAFKDTNTGREWTQDITSEVDLYRLGLGMLAPQTVYDNAVAQVRASDAGRAESAGEEAKLDRDMRLETHKSMLKQAEKMLEDSGSAVTETRRKELADIARTLTESSGLGEDAYGKKSPEEQAQIALQILVARENALKTPPPGAAPAGVVAPGMTSPGGPPVWRASP